METPAVIFNDFLLYLHTHFPDFNVTYLLAQLQIHKVITGNERAFIENVGGPAEKMRVLLSEIMPPKHISLHRNFVTVLKDQGSTELARYLEEKLDRLPLNDGIRNQTSGSNTNATPNSTATATPTDPVELMQQHLLAKLESEGKRLFKAQWRASGGEMRSGSNWSVAITGEESNYPLVGPKQKKNEYFVVVMDRNGAIQERTFDARSRSWNDNHNTAFPKINAWVSMVTGTNPNLG